MTLSPSGRTSHEVRGLKSFITGIKGDFVTGKSHLTRGAWIEIFHNVRKGYTGIGRTSHEVRGLKYGAAKGIKKATPVAPHTRCVD